jgi:hypothetical protein
MTAATVDGESFFNTLSPTRMLASAFVLEVLGQSV